MGLDLKHLTSLREWMTKDLNGTRLLIISNSTEECSAIVHDGNLVVSYTLHVGGELFHF